MNATFDSIYPEFIKAGLDRLQTLGGHRELLALFTALENFRRDQQTQDSLNGVLQVAHHYIAGLGLFHTSGFFLVNPKDFGFDLLMCAPQAEHQAFEKLVSHEIQGGRFAWALRQNAPVFFQAGNDATGARGVFHSLAQPGHVVGMFCGLLRPNLAQVQDIAFSVLSILLGASADALRTLRKTAQLAEELNTLTGLLPICAWCKKVRDDYGYWEQIERYVETRSEASFSHGICPSCREKYFPAEKPNKE